MNIVITGASGFLGTRVADALLAEDSKLPVAKLLLVDVVRPQPHTDPRVSTLAIDLSEPSAANLIIKPDIHVLFHLAALVSGHAEADFDLGLHINFDATRALAEAARFQAPLLRFIFTSTVGVFGGTLPSVIDDITATTPQNSYGTAKAMCELLLNDYGRRGFADTRIVRLPTVSIRAGIANKAVTSFASGIIREPLNGEESICPVDLDLKLWLTSPSTVVQNIIHAATLPRDIFGTWRVINLPGISVSVSEMIQALREVAGDKVASLIRFEHNDLVARIVGSFPDIFDNTRALGNGFVADKSFKEMILMYIRDEKNDECVEFT